MSRTFRNRHSVPKGMKVRDGCGNVCYDSNGKRYWTNGDYTGANVSWRVWFPDVEWLWGHGDQILPYHLWKMALFGSRKMRHETWQVKRFGSGCGCWKAATKYRYFAKKSYRCRSNMLVRGEEWEKLNSKGSSLTRHWW